MSRLTVQMLISAMTSFVIASGTVLIATLEGGSKLSSYKIVYAVACGIVAAARDIQSRLTPSPGGKETTHGSPPVRQS
jgi:hypothetical protein